jgi:hypothetical protein
VEGYEGVAALVRGRPPQTPPVCQGRAPETRIGCAGGRCVLQSGLIQSLENVVYHRLLLGNFRFQLENVVF